MPRRMEWMLAAAVAMAIAPVSRADERHGAPHQPTGAAEAGRTSEGTEAGAAGAARTTEGTEAPRGTPKTGVATTESGKAEQISQTESTELLRSLYAQSALDLETAKLAKERSEDEQVKQFADRVEREHARLGEKLEQLASGRGVTLDKDEALKGGRQEHIEDMRKMSATEFDAHFKEMMVADHEKFLSEVTTALERAEASGDKELAAVLQEAKPTIQEHHQSALTLGEGAQPGSLGSGADAPDAPAQDRPAQGPAQDQPAQGAPGQQPQPGSDRQR
jgi:putative membrane protein